MHWFQGHTTPEVAAVMRAVTRLGSRPVVGALSALVALGLVVEPCWQVLVEWLLVVPGGMLLNALLKGLADRPRPGHKVAIVLTAEGLITLVGVSRLALGVHYLSDVLAAGAVSLSWLALCHAAVDTWRHTRARRLA